MDWILQILTSGDTSLKVKNLRLFKQQADIFLQRKLSLTLHEYRNPHAPENIETIKLYFFYYNIVCYSIENTSNPGFAGFLIPNLFDGMKETKKSIILKRAISKAINSIPFTLGWDTQHEMYCVMPIFSKEYETEIPQRQNRQHMSETDVGAEMEDLFSWVKGYVDGV